MKKLDLEWPVIRGAVAALAVCALLSAALIYASSLFRDAMRNQYQTYDNQFKEVSRRYLNVDVEEAIIKEQYPRFIKLYKQGVIGGKEQRLNWVEALQIASSGIQLPSLNYQIESRTKYTPDFPLPAAGYETYATNMHLDLGLLHENDMKRLFEALNKRASGLYSVRKCGLKKAKDTIEPDPEQANITAQCELTWFTIEPSGGREIKIQELNARNEQRKTQRGGAPNTGRKGVALARGETQIHRTVR